MKRILIIVGVFLTAGVALRAAPVGPLRVSEKNPRYFAAHDGRIVYLAGAHDGWEWQDFAWGDKEKDEPFAWDAFLKMLSDNGHNVIRFWSVEHTKINDSDSDRTEPMPWLRVAGQGRARDGGNKFDLDRFNSTYFDRLRERVSQAGDHGIYVIVMLFQGWSIDDKGGKVNPWPYHPFQRDNNVNQLDGDPNGDGQGSEVHTWLGEQHPVTKRQRSYVRHVVDTVKDFDHVLFEIANESHTASLDWQNRMVDFIRECERGNAKKHPIGITVPYGGPQRARLNRELFASKADWISPNQEAAPTFNFRSNPPPVDGRKVILSDSDHLHGNNLQDPVWIWKTFCRGNNILFMDRWTEEPTDPLRIQVRRAVGLTVQLAKRLDLTKMVPSTELASTGFCLAHGGWQYVVFQPDSGAFTLDLSEAPGSFNAEWIHPTTGERFTALPVPGGSRVTCEPAFKGPAVLYLSKIKS